VTWEMWLGSDGDDIVLTRKGSLTGSALERIERALNREISACAGRSLRIELTDVRAVDADGIAMLRRSRHWARMHGARLTFATLSPEVWSRCGVASGCCRPS
jgi:anti-anti-sigma regulatory factor